MRLVSKGWDFRLWDTDEGYIMYIHFDHGVVGTSNYYLLTVDQVDSVVATFNPDKIEKFANAIIQYPDLFRDQVYKGELKFENDNVLDAQGLFVFGKHR